MRPGFDAQVLRQYRSPTFVAERRDPLEVWRRLGELLAQRDDRVLPIEPCLPATRDARTQVVVPSDAISDYKLNL
jgi:hypothetical protein